MSVRKRGEGYEVRWSEGGRKRSRTFVRKGDADAFDLDVKRRKQLGPLAGSVIASRQTLAEFMEAEYWPRYAIPNLTEDTRRRYLEVWGTDLLPRVGGYAIREISPEVVEDLLGQLKAKGLSPASRLKAVNLLSGILRRAVVRGIIPANPVLVVDKPKVGRGKGPNPLAPATIERIRQFMLTEAWSSTKRGTGRSGVELQRWRVRNATIVSLAAYGGLRPMEDRSSAWGDVREGTLFVWASKTRKERHVDLLSPLAQDLAEWRLLSGRPGAKALIVPRTDGQPWTKSDWDNWRRRVWHPAAKAAGAAGATPYDLRDSFVSLLLWSGMDLVEVADQAGHSVATLARHYAGVIKELRGQPKVPADEAIRKARDAQRTQHFSKVAGQ